MEVDDIMRVCAEVSRFSRKANWTWKALPVIEWEFPTISDFARAKMELLKSIGPMVPYEREASWQRATSPNTYEIDCHAVTFRLICRETIRTPHGTFSAAEIIYTSQEEYEKRLRDKS